MKKLVDLIRKAKKDSNEASAWISASLVSKDLRYVEICEKIGNMTDSYNAALIGLTEELYKQRQEFNKLNYRLEMLNVI